MLLRYVAAFWDNSDGGHADHDDQMLLASQEDEAPTAPCCMCPLAADVRSDAP